MNVSIVIPTKNRAATLARCLKRLVPQLTRTDEVIVVDNDSTDDTKQIVDGFGKRYRVLYRVETRRGASHCRNTGARIASREGIAFIDDDSMVSPRWLAVVRSTLSRRKTSVPDAVYQGAIRQRYETDGLAERVRLSQFHRETTALGMRPTPPFPKLTALIVANIFTYRATLSRFPEPFLADVFPFIGEDQELACRLIRHHIPLFYVHTAAVTHEKKNAPLGTLLRQAYLYGRTKALLERMYLHDPTFINNYGLLSSRSIESATLPALYRGVTPAEKAGIFLFHAAMAAAKSGGYHIHTFTRVPQPV